jgi:hypothetical protein
MSVVRVIYIVPSDAEPWPEAKGRATDVLEDLQWFFAEEMDRLSHGRKTFGIARDANGSLLFHQIKGEFAKKEFLEASKREYPKWCREAAMKCGLFDDSYITVYFIEAYNITSGKVSANCSGWARNGGEAFLSSFHLKVAICHWIADTSGYGRRVFDWIDLEPLAENLRVGKNKRGPALGDLSGAGYGIIAHELAHCFNLPPQEKGKRGRTGPLMGVGQLGMRGYFRPDLTSDRCWLRIEDGQALKNSKSFDVRELKPKLI